MYLDLLRRSHGLLKAVVPRGKLLQAFLSSISLPLSLSRNNALNFIPFLYVAASEATTTTSSSNNALGVDIRKSRQSQNGRMEKLPSQYDAVG